MKPRVGQIIPSYWAVREHDIFIRGDVVRDARPRRYSKKRRLCFSPPISLAFLGCFVWPSMEVLMSHIGFEKCNVACIFPFLTQT